MIPEPPPTRAADSAQKPRLAIVIPTLHGAGAERFLSELLPQLAREFEAELILYAREIDYPVPPGIPITSLGDDTSAERSLGSKALRFVRRVRRLRAVLARGRFDVVFSLVDMNNVVAYAAARWADTRLPLVVAERTISENFFRFNPHARRMAPVIRTLLSVVYNRADRVVALSRAMRRYLAEELGVRRPIDVIESGVDLSAFYPPGDGQGVPAGDGKGAAAGGGQQVPALDDRFQRARIRILNVARLDDNKDQALLIDVLGELRRRVAGAELFIIGSGPNEAALRNRISVAGLDGVVHLLGWRTDVPDYMRAADVFCLSSHHEGTPRTVIEALACGLPVVVTRSTEALSDVLEHGRRGLLVDVGDRAGFRDALLETLTHRAGDSAHRRELSAYARRRFDIVDKGDQYVELLRAVSGAPRGGR